MVDGSNMPGIAVVTGADGDLGRLVALRLAESGWTVVVHASTAQGAEEAAERLVKAGVDPLRLHTAVANASRLAEVRSMGHELAEQHPALGLLVHTEHVGPAERRVLTPDGHERTFQINYLAPFLLTLELRRALIVGEGRVVALSSVLHRGGSLAWTDLSRPKGYTPLAAYAQATLAVSMFTAALVGTTGLSAISVDPGSDDPDIFRLRRRETTPAEHAADILTGLCPPAWVRDGAFYQGLLPAEAAVAVANPRTLGRLWRLTQRLVEPR